MVFCDIEEDSYNISPEGIEAAITPRTQALLPVHLYGQPARIDRIKAIAEKHGLALIEDCAQTQGAESGGCGGFPGLAYPSGHQIAAGAALQGLAGLQLMEALRLIWSKVALEKGLIEISGEVKNGYRNQVIPACAKVIEILARCRLEVYGKTVVPNGEDPVVPNLMGFSYMSGKDSSHNYSKRLRSHLREWKAATGWAAKDPRNALPTFAVIEGIHSNLWEQYIGHAPVGVTARHYTPKLTSATRGEGNALDRQKDLFRILVLGPIEEKMSRKRHNERVREEAAERVELSKSIEISG